MFRLVFFAFSLTFWAGTLLSQPEAPVDTRASDAVIAFTNVNLIPMTEGATLVPGQTVVVADGRIEEVGPAGVMVRGLWMPRAYLEARLAAIAEQYAE